MPFCKPLRWGKSAAPLLPCRWRRSSTWAGRPSAARAGVRQYLAGLAILAIDRQILLDADALAGSDFEDNILIAAAVRAAVDAIVTRNVADFAHAPVPVWEPAELLRRLAGAGAPPPAGPGPTTGSP